jgi:hypothetical protein
MACCMEEWFSNYDDDDEHPDDGQQHLCRGAWQLMVYAGLYDMQFSYYKILMHNRAYAL